MKERQTLRVYSYEANILIHPCMEHVEIPVVLVFQTLQK